MHLWLYSLFGLQIVFYFELLLIIDKTTSFSKARKHIKTKNAFNFYLSCCNIIGFYVLH